MDARLLIAEFAARAGLPDFPLDDRRAVRLGVDDAGLAVDFELDEAQGVLHLYTVLAFVPADADRERLFEHALGANLFGRETGGGMVGFDSAAQELLLTRQLHVAAIDHAAFESALEAFINAGERLRRVLSAAGAQDAARAGDEFARAMVARA
jgi:hypothetical protein